VWFPFFGERVEMGIDCAQWYFTKAVLWEWRGWRVRVNVAKTGLRNYLQTSVADFLSKISEGGDPQDCQFVHSGVDTREGTARGAWLWFWPG
jgi:hypothetical protein